MNEELVERRSLEDAGPMRVVSSIPVSFAAGLFIEISIVLLKFQ